MAKKDPLAAAMALLAEAGVELKEKPVLGAHNYRSKDAVVVFANLPAHFKPGICKTCKKPYAFNKPAVGFCSDVCRREDWFETTGVEWAAVSTNDVWNGDPPMIITPVQLANLKRIADWFNKNQTALEIRPEKEIEQELQVLTPEADLTDFLDQAQGTQSPEPSLPATSQNDLPTIPQTSPFEPTPVGTTEADDLFGF